MDRETGIGTWTDAQITIAIREGKRPDGSVIGPPMPIELYNHMSDRDTKAIVAYLRTVKPVKNKVRKSVFRMPLHAAKPAGKVADVSRADPVRYGAYLAGPVGHCIECHTPRVRNITPHPEDGLGKWTDAQIMKAITEGVRPDGTKLNPPMAYPLYKTMKASDLNAIVAYLRSLKPLSTK
jgi:mono/diheme cytochrome c family protein